MPSQGDISPLALEAAHPAFGQAAFHFRAFSALASVILHAAVFTGIFLVGVGGEMGPAGDGSGGLSIIHVGGVASPAVSAPAGSDDISPVAPATSSVEQVAEVQKAVPVRIEKKVKTEERTKPAKPAKSVNSTNRAERSGEPAQPEAAASAGGAGGGTASGGLGDAAKPGTIAGDGKPFVFSLAEVNGKPGIVKRVPVVYPRDARQKHVTGQVLVRFHLDADGTVSHLSIKSASPPDIFNENTLAAVRQWRFSPATMGGRPVPVWVELPIEFDLRR